MAPACLAPAECDPRFDKGLTCADRPSLAGSPVGLALYRVQTEDFIRMDHVLAEAADAQQAAATLKGAWNV